MITLDSSHRHIAVELTANSVSPLPVVATFTNINLLSQSEDHQTVPTFTNNTNSVIVVSSPINGYRRRLGYLSVQNINVANGVVMVKFVSDDISYTLANVELASGDQLQYTENRGFEVLRRNVV